MTTQARQPEYELADGRSGTVRYLEHDALSPLIRWHCHAAYELHYLVQGHGKMFIGDYIGPFGPGQLVLTGPQVPHNWVSMPSAQPNNLPPTQIRDRVIHFDQSFIDQTRQAVPEFKALDKLFEASTMGLIFVDYPPEQAEALMLAVRNTQGLRRVSAFIELLDQLNRWEQHETLSTARYSEQHDTQTRCKIDRAVAFISKHYTEPLCLADVACHVSMSETHFSRLFKQVTGVRFVEFINRLRIHNVCQLLLETDLQISTICYQVGFNNIANFNRQFQSLKQLTPREYRNQARSQFINPSRHTVQTRVNEFF